MNKLKQITYCFIVLLISMLFYNCKELKEKAGMEKKYDWSVSANAPKGYPASFYYGSIDYKGGGTTIRGGGTLQNGWGMTGSGNASGDKYKPLPERLNLVYISFVEDQFYKGSFELDQEKIKKILEEGYINKHKGNRLYDFEFVVNVAPGGVVGVWMNGGGIQTEVGFYKAEKTEVKWHDFVPNGEQDRSKFVQPLLEHHLAKELLEQYEIEGIDFDQWENYRKKYDWSFALRGENEAKLNYNDAEFFNGEKDVLFLEKINIDHNKGIKALPSYFYIRWKENDQREYIVEFDIKPTEFDKMVAFMEAHGGAGVFELEVYPSKNIKKIKLYLKSATDQIEIALEPYTVYASRKNLDL